VIVTRDSALTAACLATTWLVWGSTYLGIRFALASFPPFFQMGTRFLAAGCILLAWGVARGQALPNRIQWRNAAIIGGLLLGVWMGGIAYAEQTVASGLVMSLVAILPALIALVNLFFGVKPARLEMAGIVIGVGGVLLLVRGAGFSASPAGLVAVVIACASWAVGSVLAQRRFHAAPGAMGFASQMLCGGVTLMTMSWIAGESMHWPPQPQALLAWCYLTVFGSIIAFSCYMTLLARTSAVLASSYSFVTPAIGLFLGVTLGGETVTEHEWQAITIIIVGVMMLILGRDGSTSRSVRDGRSQTPPVEPAPSRSHGSADRSRCRP